MPSDQRCVLRRRGARRHGHHFPNTEKRFKNADSIALLADAAWRVRAAGWKIGNIGNIGSTVDAQAVKMAPHILAMRQRIGHTMLLPIEARAICLLVRPAA